MEIVAELLLLLVAARICGEVAVRYGHPAAVGEILAGVLVLVGWSAMSVPFPNLPSIGDNGLIQALALIGMFFLILQAGMEMSPSEIKEASGAAFGVALGGMVVPLLGGYALGVAVLPDGPNHTAQALVLGVAMAITAIPATVRVLEELGMLHSRIGKTIVAAALFDDIFGMVLLAVLTAIIQYDAVPSVGELAWLLIKVAVFFIVTALIGAHLYAGISRRMRELQAMATEFSALIVMALLYGGLAEGLGIHWILGAFMAGLYFEKERVSAPVYVELNRVFEILVRGLLAPLFFVGIGLQIDLGVIERVPEWVLIISVLAFVAKFIGSGLPALAFGFGWRGAAIIGSGMSARGAVELVILGIVVDAGLFNGNGMAQAGGDLFSALVIMAALNTLFAPIVVRALVRGGKP